MLISNTRDNSISSFTELSCGDDPFHKEFTTFCIGFSSQFWYWWRYYGFLPSVGCWCWEPVLPSFSHQQLPAAANWRRANNPSFCQNFHQGSQKISIEFSWRKPMVDISFGINFTGGLCITALCLSLITGCQDRVQSGNPLYAAELYRQPSQG